MISEQARKIKASLVRDVVDSTPIVTKRRAWEQAASLVAVPSNMRIENVSVGGVPCMLHTPVGCRNSSEVILYIHGGGLVEGSVVTSREWCARLGLAVKQPVLSIDYRLAPECPFPAALNDVVAVCNAVKTKLNIATISSIGADSTGSVLALQALVLLREQGAFLPASCFFLSPSLDLTFSSPSIVDNADVDLVVSEDVLQHYARLYTGNRSPAAPEISPLYSDLHNLPPILVHVDDSELLLDDARRLKDSVSKSGGSIRLILSQELWHVWPTWGDFPESRIATEQIVEHIRCAALQASS